MATKRPSSEKGQEQALYAAWRWLLHVSRTIHHNKRYPPELHAFAPRVFNERLTKYHIPEDDDLSAIDDYRQRGSYTLDNMFYRSDFMAQLHNPFPSSPQVPPIIGFHFYRDKRPVAFHNFAALYSAKHFIDYLIEESGEKPKWTGDNSLEIGDLAIVGEAKNDLERIFEYTLTPQEEKWVLPAPYPRQALALLHRTMPFDENASQARETPPSGKTPRKQRPEAASKPARQQKPAIDNAVTIASIADELKMTPKDARIILRRLKVTKPAHGRWEWPATEAAQIKATLKENAT